MNEKALKVFFIISILFFSINFCSNIKKSKKKLHEIQNWFKLSWDKQKSKYISFKDRISSSGIKIDIKSFKQIKLKKSSITDEIDETEEVDTILSKIKSVGEEKFLEMTQAELRKLRNILKRKVNEAKIKLKKKDLTELDIQLLNKKIFEIHGVDRFLLEKTLSNYVWSSVLPSIVQMLSLGMIAWQICDSISLVDGGCVGLPEPIERVSGLALIPDDPLNACSDVVCGGTSQYDNIRFGSEKVRNNDYDILEEQEEEIQVFYDDNVTHLENNQYLIDDSESIDIDIELLKNYYLSSEYPFYALGITSILFSVAFLSAFFVVIMKSPKKYREKELYDPDSLSFTPSHSFTI